MEDQKDKAALVEENVETRRQMLRKIGLVLAGTAAASIPVEVLGQVTGQTIKRPTGVGQALQLEGVKTAFEPNQSGEYRVFVAIAKTGGASAVVVRSNDQETAKRLQAQLGVSPCTATLSGGMIQVNLGKAAAGRCSGNGHGSAVGTFGGPGGPVESPLQLRR